MKNIEYILNDCLNKALCQKGRIQQPSSNTIADFVSKYIQAEKLTLTDVSKAFYCLEGGIKGSEHVCKKQCDSCNRFQQ